MFQLTMQLIIWRVPGDTGTSNMDDMTFLGPEYIWRIKFLLAFLRGPANGTPHPCPFTRIVLEGRGGGSDGVPSESLAGRGALRESTFYILVERDAGRR